ncbi:glycosyl transferase [Spirosoma taeanense]|uniref:Glycosyl transferase n=1 Tax=Spirosoma taeanense TaxID=2735870 RepID=A0A6M5YDX1_9BACT|nr:glycosyltransferase family 39 protein [Spirosoma taeanense]QJW91493.1 glycosyl transferase [Spirosoma taeanense]
MTLSDSRLPLLPLDDRWFYALAIVGIFLNATGLFSPILEPDGALYACLAKTIAQSGDFVNLYAVGSDWLDKPHFPFWVTAVSYLVFGINSFAYKFPALLFTVGSAVYTYHFARLVYPKLVAQVAVLVFMTAFHGVLSNNDVRAEPYLTPLIIGAVYHYYRIFLGAKGYHLVIGALLTGCALMTKGPFVLVPIGAGLVVHWLLTGQWRELLKLRWYLAVGLSLLFTAPEFYALYEQFDLHPEKVVFGQTGVSGVRFFFWDSQFGRFFNTGPIKGAGDKLFFTHTLLWAFLPWSLPLYIGTGKALAGLVRRQPVLPEYVSLGVGLATFLLFSLSGFQLPHYLNIVFPFYAILTAQFLTGLKSVNLRRWTIGQSVIGALLIVLAMALLVIVQPDRLTQALVWGVVITFATITLFRPNNLLSLAGRMVGAMLVLMGVLNLFIYPTLMQYQAGMTVARYVNSRPASAQRPTVLYLPGTGPGGGSFWTYEFYVDSPVRYARTDSALRAEVRRQPSLVFTTGVQADSLAFRGFTVQRLAIFPYYHVSQLTYNFLNRETRAQTLMPYILAEIKE